MQTIFNKTTKEELIDRINLLKANSKAKWGKMDVYQMIKHCTLWEEMIQSKQNQKRMFVGRLFGKMALKSVLKDEAPLRRSTPTAPTLVITSQGDVKLQKAEWITRVKQYEHFSNPNFEHLFLVK